MLRAARLHRLILALGAGTPTREELMAHLGIGLRTLYRELELLRRCGIRVKLSGRRGYVLETPSDRALGQLPCPDPQLCLADLDELTAGSGPAARHLDELRRTLLGLSGRQPKPRRSRKASS
jgi:biotin operon repressor